MAQPDVLFKGVPNQYVRGYVRDAIQRLKPGVVVTPCSGAFALASTAAQAGHPLDQIVAGDITLYSSVIGAYLAGDEMRLEAKGEWEWLNEHMQDPLGRVAAVTLAIRTMQYNGKTVHSAHRKRELIGRRHEFLQAIRESAAGALEHMRGIRYHARDLWESLDEYRDREDALLLVDPPWYKGGYTKMFAGVEEAFDWDVPPVPEFDPADAGRMIEFLGEGKATSLVFYGAPLTKMENPENEFGPPWRSVFVHRPRFGASAVATWLVSNRPEAFDSTYRREDMKGLPKAKYKQFDGIIRPDSVLRVKPEAQDVVSYYRDLLVHNLPLINTELYEVLLMDGMLLACVGFHVQNLRTSTCKVPTANLTFAFSPHHERYPKLNKLVLMSCVSSWMWDGYMKDIEGLPEKIQTTMLTKYPENKIARGVMKMTNRERQKNGMYKLTYYSDLVHRTAEETVREWLSKYGGG